MQASKISTYLHRFGKVGILPANLLVTYANPLRTFILKGGFFLIFLLFFRRRILPCMVFAYDEHSWSYDIFNNYFYYSSWSDIFISVLFFVHNCGTNTGRIILQCFKLGMPN